MQLIGRSYLIWSVWIPEHNIAVILHPRDVNGLPCVDGREAVSEEGTDKLINDCRQMF